MPIALPIILGITLEISDEDYEGSNEEKLELTNSIQIHISWECAQEVREGRVTIQRRSKQDILCLHLPLQTHSILTEQQGCSINNIVTSVFLIRQFSHFDKVDFINFHLSTQRWFCFLCYLILGIKENIITEVFTMVYCGYLLLKF